MSIGKEDHGHNSNASTYNDIDKHVTEVRRAILNPQMVFNNDGQPCYTQFFVGDDPPEDLRAGQINVQYICQAYDENDAQAYYGTMFDGDRGIAVFSAYKLTQADMNFNDYNSPQWRRTHVNGRYSL